MFHDVKVEELVVVLVAERGVQTPGQRDRLAGLVKVFGWTGRWERQWGAGGSDRESGRGAPLPLRSRNKTAMCVSMPGTGTLWGETAWVSNSSSQLSQGCCLPAAAKGIKGDGWTCESLVFPSLTQCQKLFHLKLFVETKAKSSLYTYCIYLYVVYIFISKSVCFYSIFCSCMCLDWLSSVLIILQTL